MARGTKKSDMDKPWNRKRGERLKPDSISVRKRILIVNEDTKSSCWYFDELGKMAPPGYLAVTVCGTGKNTVSLVNDIGRIRAEEEEKLKRAGVENPKFDEIWAVFDKDDFKDCDFDNAITKGNSLPDCRVAWSNPCFEYWYVLHFENLVTPIHRNALFKKLETIIPWYRSEYGSTSYRVLKGDKGKEDKGEKLHRKMAHCLNREEALKRAEKQDWQWENSKEPFHNRNPSTLVYRLVRSIVKMSPMLSRVAKKQ